jgi:hypothetical protein
MAGRQGSAVSRFPSSRPGTIRGHAVVVGMGLIQLAAGQIAIDSPVATGQAYFTILRTFSEHLSQ